MKHPELDFRKDHYWRIRNFNASGKLSRSTFQHAMKRLPDEYRKSRGPVAFGQEVYYEIADKLCSGREGHCFGMSVAAVKEWHESRSNKIPKAYFLEGRAERISEVKELTPKIRERILHLHLKQLEVDYFGHVFRLFSRNLLFASRNSIKYIMELIDQEGCALVNVVKVKGIAGHTVVAYDYRKDTRTGEYIIYVADSNHPWKQDEVRESDRSTRHPSYIRLIRASTGKYKAGLYYRNRCEGKYDIVFGVPYKYIK